MEKLLNKTFLWIFLLVWGCASVAVEDISYTKRYNLDFSYSQDSMFTWVQSLVFAGLGIDSSSTYKGKYPYKIYSLQQAEIWGKDKWYHLNYEASQQILLPEGEFSTIEVRVTSKMKNIGMSNLLIDQLSTDEMILSTDTLNFNNQDSIWHTSACKFTPSPDLKFLGLRICLNSGKGKEKIVWLDRVQIFLDKKPIDSFPFSDIPLFSVKQPAEIKELSFEKNMYSGIPELGEKKIVALGETMHGSASIHKVALQIIKHQIENNNCKLVLLEIPFELMMFADKQVKGFSEFAEDSLLEQTGAYCDSRFWNDLIGWITDYNNQHKNAPVTLMGTDLSLLETDNHKLLSYYIANLNKTKNKKILDDFYKFLTGGIMYGTSEIITFMEEHPELKEAMDSSDYALISHNLKMSDKSASNPMLRLDYRDQIMKDNVSYLIDMFAPGNERVIVYTHFDHANYGTINQSVQRPSFGSYMKDEYKDEYSCLGILAGNGNVLALTIDSGIVSKPLSPPRLNSMESYFNTFQEPFFYCRSDNFGDMLSYIRIVGIPYFSKKQFIPVNPKARMDGLIFLKESEAVKLKSNGNNKNIFMNK